MTENPPEPQEPQEPDQPQEPSPQHPDHEHHLTDEIHKIEDEAYVDSYRWGPTIMYILLAVILIAIGIVGWVWYL